MTTPTLTIHAKRVHSLPCPHYDCGVGSRIGGEPEGLTYEHECPNPDCHDGAVERWRCGECEQDYEVEHDAPVDPTEFPWTCRRCSAAYILGELRQKYDLGAVLSSLRSGREILKREFGAHSGMSAWKASMVDGELRAVEMTLSAVVALVKGEKP